MICSICKKGETSVVDSRPTEDGTAIRRRRLCVCGARFTTFERVQFREHCAGKNMDEWIDEGLDTMYKWAKSNDCQGVEGVGREGFWNWIKKRNWSETSRFFEIRFDGEKI